MVVFYFPPPLSLGLSLFLLFSIYLFLEKRPRWEGGNGAAVHIHKDKCSPLWHLWRWKWPWIHEVLLGSKSEHYLGVKNCTPQPVFPQEEVNEKTFSFTRSKKISSYQLSQPFLLDSTGTCVGALGRYSHLLLSNLNPHYNSVEATFLILILQWENGGSEVKTVVLRVHSLEHWSLDSSV